MQNTVVNTRPRPTAEPTTRGEDLATVVMATWLILGLFLDGYAHEHLVQTGESFLTPWHGVFYAGFLSTAATIVWIISRRSGDSLRRRVPPGYGGALLGIAAFAIGGIGDGLWHTVFGVEHGIDALLSPTHLVLMVSLLAIVMAPYRAALAGGARTVGRSLPIISVGIGTALVAFFVNFVWGLGDGGFRVVYDAASGAGERDVIAGVGSAIVATVVLYGAAMHVRRLGRPRVGAFTLLFGVVAMLVHVAFDEEPIGVAAAFVGGASLDLLQRLAPSGIRFDAALASSAITMWLTYFGLASMTDALAWAAELWAGTVVLCSLTAGAIGQLASARTQPPPP
jgi:hypothetical protein